MKCDYIQQRLADLFDDQVSETERTKLLIHIDQCEECSGAYADFNDLVAVLNPQRIAMDTASQSEAIMDAIMAEESPKLKAGFRYGLLKRTLQIAASVMLFIAIGAGIIFTVTYRKSAYAAERILDNSIRAMITLKSVRMVFTVRTSAGENFESIDPADGFLDFTIIRVFKPVSRWRFDKPGRTIIMDGKDQYMVNEQGGYVLKGSPKAGFLGWMGLFLEPMKVLEAERGFARDHHSSYTIREKGNLLEVSVKAAALGNYENPYALNSSVPESNTYRVFAFDRHTNMLRSLAVYIEDGHEFICVLKLTSISENVPVADSLFDFVNHNHRPVLTVADWEKYTANGLKDMDSDEAARIFFTAFTKKDWNMVARFSPLFSIPGGMALKSVRERFEGSRLLQAGESFTSGLYTGEYVPYTVVTKTGDTLSGNLAMRNDNPYHTWVVDGGY